MDNHNEHIKQYTAADIQKYLKGQLSGAEMHNMEKAALDDPFLADAMEGLGYALEGQKEEDLEAGIAELRTRVAARTTASSNTAPVRSFRWWQVAAAASVLIVAGMGIYLFSKNTANNEIAKIDHKERNVAPDPRQTVPLENKAAADSTAVYEGPAASKKKVRIEETSGYLAGNDKHNPPPTFLDKKEQPAPPAPSVFKQVDTLKDGEAVAQSEKPSAYRSYSKPKASDDLKRDSIEIKNMASIPAEVVKTKDDDNTFGLRRKANNLNEKKSLDNGMVFLKKEESAEQKLQGRISGVVVDNNYNPQANALLRIENNKNVFNTDTRGNFSIPAGDSNVNLSVTVTGYGTQSFSLYNNGYTNQLKLQPANALSGALDYYANVQRSEDSISSNNKIGSTYDRNAKYGFGDKDLRYTTSYPKVMIQDAEPQYGWVAYQQYLEKNRKLFAPNTGAPAEVVVSFQVNKSGDLSNFKLAQSLSKAYDDEAIRLIKEGPTWKLLRGRKARVTIVVRF